ncbi:MAG: c-type cytochrome [Sphingomonadaceae bacterium]
MRLLLGVVALSLVVGGQVYAGQKLGEAQGERAPEVTYAKTCGYCHGRNVGPVIRGRNLPAEAIVRQVRHGQNGMPAFRPTEITNAELDALAKWISASKADPKEKGQ